MKILLGNKCDLSSRAVTDDQIEDLAKPYGYTYFEVSAKTGQEVRNAF